MKFDLSIDRERDGLAFYLRDLLRARRDHRNCESLAALTRSYERCLREADPTHAIAENVVKKVAIEELRNERRNAYRQITMQFEGDSNEHNVPAVRCRRLA